MDELDFRFIFTFLLVTNLSIRWVSHWRSGLFLAGRKTGLEGKKHDIIKKIIVALTVVISVLYIFTPKLLFWTQFNISIEFRILGVFLASISTPIHLWAFFSLGKYYNSTLAVLENHQIVESGPYRWVRHPIYTSSLAGIVGLSLTSANGVLFAIFCMGTCLVVFSRIPKEEAMLSQYFGPTYIDYIKRTGKLLPRVKFKK